MPDSYPDQTGIGLMNLALINPQPLAQVVLALSAVEALGQGEKWSKRQTALLDSLASQVNRDNEGSAEYREVAEVLRRKKAFIELG